MDTSVQKKIVYHLILHKERVKKCCINETAENKKLCCCQNFFTNQYFLLQGNIKSKMHRAYFEQITIVILESVLSLPNSVNLFQNTKKCKIHSSECFLCILGRNVWPQNSNAYLVFIVEIRIGTIVLLFQKWFNKLAFLHG